jgi:hypothetical protein
MTSIDKRLIGFETRASQRETSRILGELIQKALAELVVNLQAPDLLKTEAIQDFL